ncbi:MAG: 1-acyl-sn-glycerol-3-phosphate acyltransferase [Treponema sp.]|jgi:1-acyl-sn-glycerol-3-phosphate acyltransferase|nr:1-acyl-sn-glycerol-3-phosphate acyltransferase [Treponema sp.]
MDLLKTIVIFSLVVISMLIVTPFGLAALLLSLLGLKRPMRYATYRIAQAWALVVLVLSGCSLTVTGAENIPRRGGFCLAGNHNSIFDIVLLLAAVGRPFGFIAKKELAVFPLLNIWILMLGGLFIDRKSIRKAVGVINEGVRRIKKGGAMLIFPEGTRSKGRGLLPFKGGALKLATKASAPIVPLAMTGSYEVFEKDRRVRPGPVSVRFAPPVLTAGISAEETRDGLADQVYGIINGMLEDAGGSVSAVE